MDQKKPRKCRRGPEGPRAAHEGRGHPPPTGRGPCLVDSPETPFAWPRLQHLLYIQKPPENNLDREFRR